MSEFKLPEPIQAQESQQSSFKLPEPINNEQSAQPTTTPTNDDGASKLRAMGEGLYDGINTISSSIAKFITTGVDKLPKSEWIRKNVNEPLGLEVRTPSSVQKDFETDRAIHKSNPDVQAHPNYATAGNIVGQVAMTAPLGAATAGNIAGIFGGQLPGKVGAIADIVGSSVLQGATQGGLTNTEGQGASPWNYENAQQGAKFGALFSPVNLFMNNYAGKVSQLQGAKEAAAKSGYKGTIYATDLPSQGIIDSVTNTAKNLTLGNVPNWLGGTNLYRNGQYKALTDTFTDYASSLSKYSLPTISKKMQQHVSQLDNEYGQLWGNVSTAMKNSGVDTVTPTLSRPVLDDILATPKGLTSKETDILKQGLKDLSPEDMITYKRDVYGIYSRLAKKVDRGNYTSSELAASDKLNDLYWNSISDLKESVGTDSAATKAFETANQFTVGYKNLFDPKTNGQLVRAVDDLKTNKNLENVQKYFSYLMQPNRTQQTLATASKAIGDDTMQDLAYQQVKQMLVGDGKKTGILGTSVSGKPEVNLSKFLDSYEQLPNTAQAKLYQPAIDDLKGLSDVARQYLTSQQAKTNLPDWVKAGVAGSAGAGAAFTSNLPLAGGLVATLSALSYLTAKTPLKTFLATYSKTANNPELRNYLIKGFGRVAQRVGISLQLKDDGSMLLDKQEKK